jgi:hypothetical protein
MEQWLKNLFVVKCKSNCDGNCNECKRHAASIILKGSALVGGVFGGGLTLVGQLFTGFDMGFFCLVTGGCAFMASVCGAALCAELGLVRADHDALRTEIEKGNAEKIYRDIREREHRSAMHLYEMRMSNYRCFPSSGNLPTRPNY